MEISCSLPWRLLKELNNCKFFYCFFFSKKIDLEFKNSESQTHSTFQINLFELYLFNKFERWVNLFYFYRFFSYSTNDFRFPLGFSLVWVFTDTPDSDANAESLSFVDNNLEQRIIQIGLAWRSKVRIF